MSFSLIYMTSIKNIQYNFADKVTKKWASPLPHVSTLNAEILQSETVFTVF